MLYLIPVRPERELISLIRRMIARDPEELLELGRDDASARKLSKGIYVFNTDMVAEGTDLLPGMSPKQLARKCVISNFSDLAAKGGRPIFFMASMGLPVDIGDEDFLDMIRGFNDGSKEYGAHFVGGDLGESEEIVLAGFAVGRVERRLVSRSGARLGDILLTTGEFGLTWLAFQHLLKKMDLPSEARRRALEAVYEPKARVEEGVVASIYASSSVDSSDGLFWSLWELSKASGYGFLVEKLPLHPLVIKLAERGVVDPLEAAFHGGEEYELVLTVPQNHLSDIEEEFRRRGMTLIRIGRVVEEGILVKVGNEVKEVEEGGWEHFKPRH